MMLKIEAWAPLGQGNKDLFAEPIITALANKYGKDAGQIILRFEVQEGIIVLPKSTKKFVWYQTKTSLILN